MWFQVVQVWLLSSQCVGHSGDCREGRRASRGRDVDAPREVQQEVPQETLEVIQLTPQERISGRIVEQIFDVLVPQIQEQIVEVVKVVPQERVSKRIVEQVVDVPVPQSWRRSLKLFTACQRSESGRSTSRRQMLLRHGVQLEDVFPRPCRVEQKAPTSVSWRGTRCVVVCEKSEVTSVEEGHDVTRH